MRKLILATAASVAITAASLLPVGGAQAMMPGTASGVHAAIAQTSPIESVRCWRRCAGCPLISRLYRSVPALHELDCEAAGFEWIVADDTDRSVFAWQRKARDGRAPCVVVVSFTPTVRYDYGLKIPRSGRWREILNSDAAIYGGSNVGNAGSITATDKGSGPELNLVVPSLAGLFLVPEA